MIIFLIIFLYFIIFYYIIPFIIKKIYYKRLNSKTNKKYIYLTFDDGPHPEYTFKVLELLKKYNVKATFFLLGEKAKQYPEIVNKIKEEGHSIGIHGYKHLHGWFSFPINYLIDLIKAEFFFKKLLKNDKEEKKILYRPTYGKLNFFTLLYIFLTKKKVILWDLDTKDFESSSLEECIDNIKFKLNNCSIILMHDSRINNNELSINITLGIMEYILINKKSEKIEFKNLIVNK